jgi:hypothetical protein
VDYEIDSYKQNFEDYQTNDSSSLKAPVHERKKKCLTPLSQKLSLSQMVYYRQLVQHTKINIVLGDISLQNIFSLTLYDLLLC